MSRQEGFSSNVITLNDIRRESKNYKGKKKKKTTRRKPKHLGKVTRLAPTPPPSDAYDPNYCTECPHEEEL